MNRDCKGLEHMVPESEAEEVTGLGYVDDLDVEDAVSDFVGSVADFAEAENVTDRQRQHDVYLKPEEHVQNFVMSG